MRTFPTAEHPTDFAAGLSDQQTKMTVFGEETAAFEEGRKRSSEVAAESAIALQKVRKSYCIGDDNREREDFLKREMSPPAAFFSVESSLQIICEAPS
jgi:hypothetical protein